MKNLFSKFIYKSSYSQEGEDLVMKNWLPETHGSYIDLGSGFPIWGSNSYLFYKKGWRGLCIDALDRNISLTKIFRRKDSAICAMIGEKEGSTIFWEFDSYEYSTANQKQAETVMQSFEFKNGFIQLVKKSKMEMININSFVEPCNPMDAFFVSIDLEGYDFKLIELINWDNFNPRVICIEDSEALAKGRKSDIDKFLSGKNYFRVATTPLSSIYVSNVYLSSLS